MGWIPVGVRQRDGRHRRARLVGIAVAAAVLTGCAQAGAVRDRAVEVGREAADETLTTGILLTCDAPTAGSLRRRFGDNAELAAAWKNFCDLARAGETVGP